MPDPGDGLFEEPGKSKKREQGSQLAFDLLFEPLRNDTRYSRVMNP